MLMLRFSDRNIQSNMGKNIGVDAILTFDPYGHLQGHKVLIVFNIIWIAIAGENAQQRRPVPYYITAECDKPNCPLQWFMASLPH